MAEVIVMPKLGYTQDEGTISEWLKKEGDTVSNGEPFFDVQTDKSIITVEASCSGTVLKIALEPGVTVPVLTPVAVVGQPGEDAEAALAGHVPRLLLTSMRTACLTMRKRKLQRLLLLQQLLQRISNSPREQKLILKKMTSIPLLLQVSREPELTVVSQRKTSRHHLWPRKWLPSLVLILQQHPEAA